MKRKQAKKTVPEIPKILATGKNFGKLGCIIVVQEDFLKKVNRFYMEIYKKMNELLPQKYRRTASLLQELVSKSRRKSTQSLFSQIARAVLHHN